jgi:preprotein translocase subunit SecD
MDLYFARTIQLFDATMISRRFGFNIIFCGALAVAIVQTGCSSPKTKEEKEQAKETSTLQLHLESPPDGSPFTTTAQILRDNPVLINILRTPFLDETSIERAAVIDTAGGHAIRVQFDRHGALMLESVSSLHRGKRIAIVSQFPESRWLAAPRLAQRLTSGILTFTPDASREEAERIVRGLNNLAIKEKRQPKPSAKPAADDAPAAKPGAPAKF